MSNTLEILAAERCSAILRTPHAEAVEPAMRAAVDGGFRVIEFTLNTPGALDQIANFSAQENLLVGAGTVLTIDDAKAARDAGARFLVSTVVDEAVIRWTVEQGLVCIPGTFTPTEMLTAHQAGAQIVKLFPAPPSGPDWLRACLGPLPFLRIFPTNGVTQDNAAQWLQAGAFGVGFVGCLFEGEDMQNGRFESIRERANLMTQAVKSVTEP